MRCSTDVGQSAADAGCCDALMVHKKRSKCCVILCSHKTYIVLGAKLAGFEESLFLASSGVCVGCGVQKLVLYGC